MVLTGFFGLFVLVSGLWVFTLSRSALSAYNSADCAIGLAFSDTLDSNNGRHFANKTLRWRGLNPALEEGRLILKLIDRAKGSFEDYLHYYPKSLFLKEKELREYINEDIYVEYKDKYVTDPENSIKKIQPTLIESVGNTTSNILSDLNDYVVPAIIDSNTSYVAADFVLKKYDRKVILKGLDSIEDLKYDVQDNFDIYWESRERESIGEVAAQGIYSTGIIIALLCVLSVSALVLWYLKRGTRLFLHCSYVCYGIIVAIICLMLLTLLPASSVLSDACYVLSDTVENDKFADIKLSENQTKLLRLCLLEDGNIARHYNFTEQLEFAQIIRHIYYELSRLVYDDFSKSYQSVSQSIVNISLFQENLHLESNPSVNRSIHSLNTLTNAYDKNSSFPDCKILIDFWKLHAFECSNTSYRVNASLGNPSCLRVEEWEEIVFNSRYTLDNIKCPNKELILEEIREKFDPLAQFAEDTHKLYTNLHTDLLQYKDLLNETYKTEISVIQDLILLVKRTRDLLNAVGDDNSGFISHTNCSNSFANSTKLDYAKEAYQRAYKGICVGMLEGLKKIILAGIVCMIILVIGIILEMRLAHKTRPILGIDQRPLL